MKLVNTKNLEVIECKDEKLVQLAGIGGNRSDILCGLSELFNRREDTEAGKVREYHVFFASKYLGTYQGQHGYHGDFEVAAARLVITEEGEKLGLSGV